jgi:hypothetical protein
MTKVISILPNEETPLLGGQRVLVVGRITEHEPEAATLADPSSRTNSRTSSIRGNINAKGQSDVAKKTPLPWAQFSIALFLQLAEPLTSQVIYPVGLPVVFSFFCFGVL